MFVCLFVARVAQLQRQSVRAKVWGNPQKPSILHGVDVKVVGVPRAPLVEFPFPFPLCCLYKLSTNGGFNSAIIVKGRLEVRKAHFCKCNGSGGI
jgi:hypothetical protein